MTSKPYTIYAPCEYFPLIMSLQSGQYVNTMLHQNNITFYMSFDAPFEHIKKLLPGTREDFRYVICAEQMTNRRFDYVAEADGSIFQATRVSSFV